MDFPKILVQVWDSQFLCFKGHRSKVLNYDVFMSLLIVLILTNSSDTLWGISSGSTLFAKAPVYMYPGKGANTGLDKQKISG